MIKVTVKTPDNEISLVGYRYWVYPKDGEVEVEVAPGMSEFIDFDVNVDTIKVDNF